MFLVMERAASRQPSAATLGLAWRGLLSGLLSIVGLFVVPIVGYLVVPGLIFAPLVIVPWLNRWTGVRWPHLVAVTISAAAYWAALMAVDGLPGVTGAAVLSLMLIPLRNRRILFGAIGLLCVGGLTDITLELVRELASKPKWSLVESIIILSPYVTWQTGTSAVIGRIHPRANPREE